jgi:hypothetical protein
MPVCLKDRYGSFDQDPTARVKRREMLTGDLGFQRGHALEVDGDDVPEFLSNRGGVDIVQDIEAKTMARQGPREFPTATVVRGWRSWRVGEVVGTDEIFGYRGKERLRTYQGVEGDEASSVAKSAGSRWSEDSEISAGVLPMDREI